MIVGDGGWQRMSVGGSSMGPFQVTRWRIIIKRDRHFYYKVRQIAITKRDRLIYYKVRQELLLQSATIFKIVTKCDKFYYKMRQLLRRYYKVRRYSDTTSFVAHKMFSWMRSTGKIFISHQQLSIGAIKSFFASYETVSWSLSHSKMGSTKTRKKWTLSSTLRSDAQIVCRSLQADQATPFLT